MCLKKLQIYSKSRTYRPVYSRMMLDVPCGKCSQCRTQQQDDWFIRIWSEIKKYNDAGGATLFATFTYRDSSLPYFELVDSETGEVRKVSCFNKKHYEIFIQAVRDFFRNRGVDFTKTSLPLHIMFPCEYGEADEYIDDNGTRRLGTHRPHYHPLLHLPKEALAVFKSEEDIKFTLQRFWPHGRVHFSDAGLFVKSEFAAKYSSKYLTKDIVYYNKPELLSFLFNEDGTRNKDAWNEFKDFAPKHWQSKGYGIDLLKYCDKDEVFTDGIDFSFASDIKRGTKKIYRVPRYIVRKALYYTDDKDRLLLNARGLKIFGSKNLFVNKLAKLNSDYSRFFDPAFIDSRLLHSEYKQLSCDNASEVISLFKTLLGNRSLKELSIYAMCLKDRGVASRYDVFGRLYIQSFEKMDIKQLEDSAFDVFKESLNGNIGEFHENGFVNDIKDSPSFKDFSFNKLSRFENFDNLLKSFDLVNYIYIEHCQKLYEQDRKNRKHIKMLVA